MYSQTLEYFHLNLPQHKITGSLYNSAGFIDSRSDTSNFGRVYSGRFKGKFPVGLQFDFYTQLNWLLHHSLDSTAGSHEFLFHLRKFRFIEMGDAEPVYGYCPIRADFYFNEKGTYYHAGILDTLIYVEEGDITKSLFDNVSLAINTFIFERLDFIPAKEKPLSLGDIFKIDSLEKSQIPLYSCEKYVDGAYLTFSSFKNQIPDLKLVRIIYRFGEINTLVMQDKKGNKIRAKSDRVYGLVDKGVPYVTGDFGCYPLKKTGNDFYFNARGRVVASQESVAISETIGWALSGFLGKRVGKEIAVTSALGTFETKLDHVDGSFIRIKEIR
jgi:hypothetical protein